MSYKIQREPDKRVPKLHEEKRGQLYNKILSGGFTLLLVMAVGVVSASNFLPP